MDKPPINWCKIRNHHSLGNTHEMPMGGSAAGGLVAAVAHHRGTSVQQRIVLFHARHATSGPRGNFFFLGVSMVMGVPLYRWMLQSGKSQSKKQMLFLGYPHFRKPPYRTWAVEPPCLVPIFRQLHINVQLQFHSLVPHGSQQNSWELWMLIPLSHKLVYFMFQVICHHISHIPASSDMTPTKWRYLKQQES